MTYICDKVADLFISIYRRMNSYNFRILVLGLEKSCKSTVIKKIFEEKYESCDSPESVSVTKYLYENIYIKVYEIKGDRKYRNIWDYFYRKCDVLLFCVDLCGSDEYMEEARYELHQLIKRNSRFPKNLLILGTRSDVGCARDSNDLILKLGLLSFIDIEVACFAISAKDDTNIELVMPWLLEQVKLKYLARP